MKPFFFLLPHYLLCVPRARLSCVGLSRTLLCGGILLITQSCVSAQELDSKKVVAASNSESHLESSLETSPEIISESSLDSEMLTPQAIAQNTASQDIASQRYLILSPHKAFYIMPAYYSFSPIGEGNKRVETKFQLSFKLGMKDGLFSPHGRLYFAYTQSAWFQNYNGEDSRPFRDIDYQPELLYSFERDLALFGGAVREMSVALVHTSNGERWLKSRTQNRLKASLKWEYALGYPKEATNFWQNASKLGIDLSLWAYVGTRSEHFLHDNPDLARYAGYGEARLYYKSPRQLFEVYARPSLYPLFVLGYTWRISENIGLYCQYTNGFGDSMYEYKTHSNRLGLGFRLWDWD